MRTKNERVFGHKRGVRYMTELTPHQLLRDAILNPVTILKLKYKDDKETQELLDRITAALEG